MIYLVVAALFGMVGFAIGFIAADTEAEKRAVKEGAGEFYLDENHTRQFRWKKP